jgi:hypothetical protein
VTDLVQKLGTGRGPVVVLGDWWIVGWAQRYSTSVASIFTVPLPGLSDDEIRQQLIYDAGLLGGAPTVVRMEGLGTPYTSYLRTICLEVGLEEVATSREGFLVVRASGNPGLSGDPCRRLALPIVRDAAGAVFLISPGELRRPVLDATTLARLAATDAPVEPRPPTEAELALPIGDPIEANHPVWRFVRGATGPVYFLDHWQRREVRDEQAFVALGGLGDQSNVLTLTDAQLGLIPLGEPALAFRRSRD